MRAESSWSRQSTKMTSIHSSSGVLEASAATVNLTGRVITAFAWQHLKAATIFRDHASNLEVMHEAQPLGAFFEEMRSYVSACVMSATACLEAFINEIFMAPHYALRSKFVHFEREFWGKNGIEGRSILAKYKTALHKLGMPPVDEKSQAFKDAWGLIELRNALIHFKPTWDPDRRRKVELVQILNDRYMTSPFVDEGADFITMKSMSAGCARWAVNTVLAFLHAFDDITNLDLHRMQGFWKLET